MQLILKSKPLLILLFIVIGLAVYGNALQNGFVYDDEKLILQNPLVHSLANIPQFFIRQTSELHYKPLTFSAYTFLYSLFQANPFGFHLVQIILHSINSILLFFFFSYFFKKPLSFFLALLFLVHPANSEVVIYASDLQDVLFVLFGLLALNMIKKTENERGSSPLLSISIPLLLLLSLFSKEMGILFIVISAVFYYVLKKRLLLKDILPLGAVIFVYGLLRLFVADVSIQGTPAPIFQISFWERFLHIPLLFFRYLILFFAPIDLATQQHWTIKSFTFSSFYGPLIILVLFLLLNLWLLKTLFMRSKEQAMLYLFFLIWFLLGLSLHLQIIPLEMTFAERWFYFPMIGLLGLIGILISSSLTRGPLAKLVLLLLILAGIAFSARTMVRNTNFKDNLTLYSHDIKTTHDSFTLENNLGAEYAKRGELDKAKTHFENSVKLAPYWWTNWYNLGNVFYAQKEMKSAENAFLKAITNGNFPPAYQRLATLYLETGATESAMRLIKKFKSERMVDF